MDRRLFASEGSQDTGSCWYVSGPSARLAGRGLGWEHERALVSL